jgi:hypothetical protein
VKYFIAFLGFATLIAGACGSEDKPSDDDDGGPTSTSSTGGASSQGGSATVSSVGGGPGGSPQGGSGGTGGGCSAPAGTFDNEGCLTFASASEICGFNSDGAICALSAGCGLSDDEGQCKINCEMGATVSCYTQADVDCLYQAAICDALCPDLSACGWIL